MAASATGVVVAVGAVVAVASWVDGRAGGYKHHHYRLEAAASASGGWRRVRVGQCLWASVSWVRMACVPLVRAIDE